MKLDRERRQRPQSSSSPASPKIPAAQSLPPSSGYCNLLTHPPEIRVCHHNLPPVSLGWSDDTICSLAWVPPSSSGGAQCTFKEASLGLLRNPNKEDRGWRTRTRVSVDPHFQVSLSHLLYSVVPAALVTNQRKVDTLGLHLFLQGHSLHLYLENLAPGKAGLQRGFLSGTSCLEVSGNQEKQELGGQCPL